MSSSSPPQIPDRFSEDKAAYALRGIGQPDIEAGVAAIRDTVKTLTLQPGVYRMVDARGDVLYVGKAKALKNRVTNYTQIMRLPKRLQRMVAQTRSMTIVTTSTEAEALLLEAQLIKRYRPPYNVLLRDDKSFPYILLRHDHDFPRIQKHRGSRKISGRYFGPYASGGAVNRTLNAMQKLFLLRSCTDSFFANRSRPCLLYQIRRCSAPCVGRIDADSYAELVADAEAFLAGKGGGVQAKLAEQMQAASEAMDYELAAVFRDRLKALTFVQTHQAINGEGLEDADVFALAATGDSAARALVEALADRLGAMIACAIQIVQPDVVVIGGGVSQAGEALLQPLRSAIGRYALASHQRGLRVVPAELGERAGVVGAALLAAGIGS